MGYVPIQLLIVGTNKIKEHVENSKIRKREKEELICVGPASMKKEPSKQKKGPVLYPLRTGPDEEVDSTRTGYPNSNGTNKPTYADIVKNYTNP